MSTLDLLCLFFACAILLYAAICFGMWCDGYYGKRRK